MANCVPHSTDTMQGFELDHLKFFFQVEKYAKFVWLRLNVIQLDTTSLTSYSECPEWLWINTKMKRITFLLSLKWKLLQEMIRKMFNKFLISTYIIIMQW